MLKRIKSPVVWMAVLAQVLLIVGAFRPDVSDNAKLIGGVIIEILTLFGVLNNPTESDKF